MRDVYHVVLLFGTRVQSNSAIVPGQADKKAPLGRSDRYRSDYGVRYWERKERASEGPRIAAGILTKATSFTRLGNWLIYE